MYGKALGVVLIASAGMCSGDESVADHDKRHIVNESGNRERQQSHDLTKSEIAALNTRDRLIDEGNRLLKNYKIREAAASVRYLLPRSN